MSLDQRTANLVVDNIIKQEDEVNHNDTNDLYLSYRESRLASKRALLNNISDVDLTILNALIIKELRHRKDQLNSNLENQSVWKVNT